MQRTGDGPRQLRAPYNGSTDEALRVRQFVDGALDAESVESVSSPTGPVQPRTRERMPSSSDFGLASGTAGPRSTDETRQAHAGHGPK